MVFIMAMSILITAVISTYYDSRDKRRLRSSKLFWCLRHQKSFFHEYTIDIVLLALAFQF